MNETAAKAQAIWNGAKPIKNNAYTESRLITPRKARTYQNNIVVPVFVDGKITSLQFINEDGTRYGLTEALPRGGYASVNGDKDSREVIYVTRQWESACSIYEAVKVPVVVAFETENLLPVAEIIKAKYPAARIIMAVGGDMPACYEAARAVSGKVAIPLFPVELEGPAETWNDFHIEYGIDELRHALIAKPKTEAEAQAPTDQQVVAKKFDDWKGYLMPGKEVVEGYPHAYDAKSKLNTYLFLKNNPMFEGNLIYNEFSDKVVILKCPAWEDPKKFNPRPIESEDFFMFAAYLERCSIKVAKDTTADAAIRVAKENRINPPRDYFEALKWDGIPRLDNWLTYYLGADEQPTDYLRLVGSKWMIGAVSRIYEPGAKFDSMLVLEGPQGLGKSTVLRLLSTFHGEEYFLDSVGDISNKDSIMAMQGKIIIEMSELASFKKSENEEIKGFITRQVDEYRPPYGRVVQQRPRYFVLAGTTNETDEGWMTDKENRRYWPVLCKAIDLEALANPERRSQLWAEAVYRYKQGERTWLSPEEVIYTSAEQKKRLQEDAWQDQIKEILTGFAETSVDAICKKLELKPKDVNRTVKIRIKNSLRMLDWYESKKPGSGRIWRNKDFRGEPKENVQSMLDDLID